MTYYFNLYDSRHHGMLLNQISKEVYDSFLEGEYEDTADLNVVILQPNPHNQYWVDIPNDYNYWDKVNKIKIFTQRPQSWQGLLFFIEYDVSSQQWNTKLI